MPRTKKNQVVEEVVEEVVEPEEEVEETEEVTETPAQQTRVLKYNYPPECNTPQLRMAFRRIERRKKKNAAKATELAAHPEKAKTPREKQMVAAALGDCPRCGEPLDGKIATIQAAGSEEMLTVHSPSCVLETDAVVTA